jgi:hypothetical protein
MISSLRLAFCLLVTCATYALAQVAPINCTAAGFSTSSGTFIGITWTDRSNDETQWAIRYYIGTSTVPAGAFAIASETRAQSNVTASHRWIEGVANTTYRFTVQSYNGVYSSLENWRAARFRGFESHPLRPPKPLENKGLHRKA